MAGSVAGRMRLAQWFGGAPTDTEKGEVADETRSFRRKRPLHNAVFALLAILFLYILVLVIGASSVARVGALSVALACASVGALLGFIFAIPKRTEVALIKSSEGSETQTQETAPAVRASLADSAYRPNTSLEEISDWLTKIIVGLGLVEARAIGRFVEEEGGAMTPALFGKDAPAILGSAALVGTVVIAFLTSFLYFRLYLAEEFTRSDLDALLAQKQFDEAREKGRTQAISPKKVLQATQESSAILLPQGTTRDAGAKTGGEPLTPTLSRAIELKLAQMRDHPLDASDPAKGVFGETSSVSSPPRSLSATVKPVRGENNWFKIDLLLTSSDPLLRDEVVFFYHPTFKVPYERVRVAGGQARVRLYAYGAFTVGVLADGGTTQLELDLTTVDGAPDVFLEN